MLFRISYLLIAFCFTSFCHAAGTIGVVTVVDGEAVFVRQTVKFTLQPGAQLENLDIIETEHRTALVKLELINGIQVNLGPETRVMLTPKLGTGSRRRQAELFTLNGWVKLTSVEDKETVITANLLSESMEVSRIDGSAVISVQKNTHQVFSESGTLVIAGRKHGKPMPLVTLKAGSYFAKTEGGKATVTAPPPLSFVSGIPKAFLDKIPPLAGRFKANRSPSVKPIEEMTYEDALPWLSAEQDVRNLIVITWAPHLNRGLRAALMRHIRSHPEWDRTLFPDKYMAPKKALAPVVIN